MTSFRFWLASLFLLGLTTFPLAAQLHPEKKKEIDTAVVSMTPWLDLISQDEYAKSWETASPLFQMHMTQRLWVHQLSQAKLHTGSFVSRKLIDAKLSNQLPLPDGQQAPGKFVVATFHADYTIAGATVERVTFQDIGSGIWKAAGYTIRPRNSAD